MRTLSGMILGLAVLAAAGCGGGASSATAELPPPPPRTDPPPSTEPTRETPKPPEPKKDASPNPPAAAAAWELDPARHAIPDRPAAGQFGGKPFAPAAEMQGDSLSFRAAADGKTADREIVIKLSPELLKKAADGLKVVVKPDQAAGPDVPEVQTDVADRKPVSRVDFAGGFALTLELGKRAAGKVPGKVFLALPVLKDGDEKAFLAGTFTADWVRPLGSPPVADEAPFVQGKLTVPAGAEVRVGYAGLAGGKLAHDATAALAFRETLTATRSETNKPRVTTLEAAGPTAGRYDHTRLDPGRYLVYAAPTGGPVQWKWVTVEPTSQLTIDFALDTKAGGLEVTVPAGTPGPVWAAPADDKPWDANLPTVAHALGMQAESKDNKASLAKLAPGKYEVRAADLSATVEVKPGETAKVELKK